VSAVTLVARTIKGLPVCSTVWDARGRAHLRHPSQEGVTVCGRNLELAGKPTVKSCAACSEGAPLANAILRGLA
jgi:hypothetical protein